MILLYSLLAVVFCLILGMIYQKLATKSDMRRHPAPGKFVEIDGRKLHYQISGVETGPIVIFDHGCGIGSSSLIWTLVSNQVSKFARVITYDRAGYGWSDAGPFPRTNEAAVEDLRILIEKTNVRGPIILVGHSYGGINVRLFAKKYSNLAAGIVLVDATHEDELTSRFPAKHVKGQLMGRKAFNMMQYLCSFGILRLMGKFHAFAQMEAVIKRYPKSIQQAFQSILFLNKTAKAVASEFSHLELGYNAVRGCSLGFVPLLVIKSGIVENVNGLSAAEVEDVKLALHDVAMEMSQLSTKGELWVAENSGHNVHVDDSDLVVKAIQQVSQMGIDALPSVR